jgi:hypothetical protein
VVFLPEQQPPDFISLGEAEAVAFLPEQQPPAFSSLGEAEAEAVAFLPEQQPPAFSSLGEAEAVAFLPEQQPPDFISLGEAEDVALLPEQLLPDFSSVVAVVSATVTSAFFFFLAKMDASRSLLPALVNVVSALAAPDTPTTGSALTTNAHIVAAKATDNNLIFILN